MTLSLNIPVLETERLILRGHEPQDFEPMAAFYANAERASGFGGPLSREDAWRWMACSIGHWALHAYGYWSVVLKETGTPCGLCGLWNPEGWPEAELGWAMYDGFEGMGLAREAAEQVRKYAYDTLGWTTLSSHIVPGNTRSVALAERLGARFEREYQNPHMGVDRIYRHPSPEELRT